MHNPAHTETHARPHTYTQMCVDKRLAHLAWGFFIKNFLGQGKALQEGGVVAGGQVVLVAIELHLLLVPRRDAGVGHLRPGVVGAP